MFQLLTEKLNLAFKHLKGHHRLSEDNIQKTVQEIYKTLLDADVERKAAKAFRELVKKAALGKKVPEGLTPAQYLVKLMHQELTAFLGGQAEPLQLNTAPPAIILMAGLQGAGKTTTTAKLALWIKESQKKSVMMASTDIYRPAALEQLAHLATSCGIPYYPSQPTQTVLEIAKGALAQARVQSHDVLIVDTAGRLHVDEFMMREIQQLHAALAPIETLFVLDGMTGQVAAEAARSFASILQLTGVVLTKMDGDARGGAALSVRHMTGKPIKFMGTGEKIEGFELFHPERIASRILGQGDILSLIEEIEKKTDKLATEKMVKKLQQGGGFSLEDYRSQLKQMIKMDAFSLLGKLPGVNLAALDNTKMKKSLTKQIAVLDSMTREERLFPAKLTQGRNCGSRKRRIALGSGTGVPDVNQVVKQSELLSRGMKKMANPATAARLMAQFQGKLPEGLF